ncbi:YHS domain-containing protein [Rhodobium orientis]|nr:YHS domain-containing (seleno)protein [Rhodobium orientis]MBB4303050.1 YHS domain-containing protein [Rhodobium orientis]
MTIRANNWRAMLIAAMMVAASATVFGGARAEEAFSPFGERVLSDPMTGLALGGYDPVAYFADRKPRVGKREYEIIVNGAVWRFVNRGNMEAFRAAPEVYTPRYGGYGALSVTMGYTVEASPLIWTIHQNRLYFFGSPVNRTVWMKDPEQFVKAGEKKWPAIEKTLVR